MTELPSPTSLMALFKHRRSIRRYKPDPVPDELVEQILEAGRWAASASNRQPWTFIVIRDKEIHKAVAQHAAFFFVQQAHVDDAPVIIALCGDAKNRVYRQFLHEDIGIAGTQMMLQAAALGLGTCWIGGMQRKAIGNILGLPPELEMVGLLTLGYPDEAPEPAARKPLEQIVHYDVYGNRSPDATALKRPVTGPLGIVLRKLRIKVRF